MTADTTTPDCREFRQFVDCYLDAEFDARDRAHFDAHLAACPGCRGHLDNQLAFRGALRPHFQRAARAETLPFEARARLRRALAEAERPSAFARWMRRLAVPVPAAAAVMSAFLLWIPTTGFVVQDAVIQHSQPVPMEIPSAQAEVIDSWFRDKLPFETTVPRFQAARLQLLGGRLTHVGGGNSGTPPRAAAYLVYSLGRHKVSVLVFDGDGIELSKNGTRHAVGSREMQMQSYNGLQVASFREGNRTYTVTSDLPETDLVSLVSSAF